MDCRLTSALETLENAVKSKDENRIREAQKILIFEAKDPISDWLDGKLGSTVADNAIFTTLPRYWEQEFHKDMDSLNVIIYINIFVIIISMVL